MKTCKQLLSVILALTLMLGAAVSVCAADGEANETTVRAVNCGSALTLTYKQTKTFDFEAENVPEGASVHVFLNGEDQGESLSFTVEEATGDYTVEAKVLDRDGGEIASSGEIKVTVQNGFFDKLGVFFRKTFHRFGDGVMDMLSAIFMTIYVFIKTHMIY